jgi:hypothetical protein
MVEHNSLGCQHWYSYTNVDQVWFVDLFLTLRNDGSNESKNECEQWMGKVVVLSSRTGDNYENSEYLASEPWRWDFPSKEYKCWSLKCIIYMTTFVVDWS